MILHAASGAVVAAGVLMQRVLAQVAADGSECCSRQLRRAAPV